MTCQEGKQVELDGGKVNLLTATGHQPPGAPDLRLVVHHQHAGATGHSLPPRGGGFGRGGAPSGSQTGRVKTNRAPVPSPSSSHSLPPFASTNPRAIVSPSPVPGAG